MHATTIEQDGRYTGTNIGRVWVKDSTQWAFEGCGNCASADTIARAFNALPDRGKSSVMLAWLHDQEMSLADAIELHGHL